MKRSHIAALAAAVSLLSFSSESTAGISLNATRVVYTAPGKEASVLVRNQSNEDVMIQSWMESDDKQSRLPFAITPSLSRLAAEKQQTLRIFYSGQGLPTDRESAFWLNVQEIPQKPKDENTLQIAVRQRIKLFYRPAGLSGKPEDAPSQLKWHWTSAGKAPLEVINDSPYHVSFARANIRSGAQTYAVQTEMIAPRSTRQFGVKELSDHTLPPGAKVEFESINDFGGIDKNQAEIAR
ncbi:molecular chaperone [Burkholderia sp. Bp9002]|nr:molecular chaperone [Burkholderia sp. Bp9002]